MATKAASKLPTAAELAAAHEELFTNEALYNGTALAEILSEIGGAEAEILVYVEKQVEPNKYARVWSGPHTQYDIDALARMHGSGDYRVSVRSKLPGQPPIPVAKRIIPMLLSPAEEVALAHARAGATALPAAQAFDAGAIVTGVTGALSPVLTQLGQIMQSIAARPAGPDPMQQLQTLSEVMRNLRPHGQAEQDPLAMVERTLAVQRMLRDNEPDSDGPRNSSGTDLLLGLLQQFGPQFAQAAALMNAHAPAALPGAAPAMLPGAAPAAPAQPAPHNEEVAMQLQIKAGIGFLIGKAAQQAEPGLYADMIVDNVPAAALADLLTQPDPVQVIAAYDARVLEHRDWFQQIFDLLKEEPANENGAINGAN